MGVGAGWAFRALASDAAVGAKRPADGVLGRIEAGVEVVTLLDGVLGRVEPGVEVWALPNGVFARAGVDGEDLAGVLTTGRGVDLTGVD